VGGCSIFVRPHVTRAQPAGVMLSRGERAGKIPSVMRVRGGGWFGHNDEQENDRARRAGEGRGKGASSSDRRSPEQLKKEKEEDEKRKGRSEVKGEGRERRRGGEAEESEEEKKERERQVERERGREREIDRERERVRALAQREAEKEGERERAREREREIAAFGKNERGAASPTKKPWWKKLASGAGEESEKTEKEEGPIHAVRAPPGPLPPGFVALDPALLHKIRELQRTRERDVKAAAAPKGPASWFRRLLRFGIALATLQPVAVTLVLNIIKLFLLFRRVVGGALDLDVDEGYKTTEVQSNTTFADVVGVDEAKKELEDIVAYLKDPAKFTRLGGKMAKGVLLWGPPGTGKTLLARAIAGEAGVPFRYASGSEFEEMYVGVGARRVRDLFQQAKKQLPCIVFLDEIDAIGSSRSMTDQQSLRQTLNQILTELDGFTSSEGLIVIAATNFPEVLDKALTRPGRFDRHVEVPNPDVKGREAILKVHSRNVTIGKDVDMHVIARGTPGFSGAELASLVNKAACRASKENKLSVTMGDLEAAKDLILMGGERSSSAFSMENRRLTAYHEGGHALVACMTDGALPVHKATIVPRGQALGMVMQLPDEDMTSWSQRQMLAEMDVCMGGRAAEEMMFGEQNITSGASSDLERATSIATSMVEKFGMSRSVGLVSHGKGGGRGRGGSARSGMSDSTQAKIDEEVRKLTEDSYRRALQMLRKNRHSLEALAEFLIVEETLTGQQVRDVLAESAHENGMLSRAGAWLLGSSPNRRNTKSAAAIAQVKDIGDRLGAVEDQVQTLSTVASQLAELANQLKEAQAAA